MKEHAGLIIIIVVAAALLIFFLFGYLFNIYEAEVRVSVKRLYADSASESVITIVPLNSFGKQTPWRKLGGTFEITEGAALVEVLSKDEENGTLKIRSRSTPGKVVIRVSPGKRMAILPSEIVIFIYPNTV